MNVRRAFGHVQNCVNTQVLAALIAVFITLMTGFSHLRIFRRRFDMMNNERYFPRLDAEWKSPSDPLDCHEASSLWPCVEWWEINCATLTVVGCAVVLGCGLRSAILEFCCHSVVAARAQRFGAVGIHGTSATTTAANRENSVLVADAKKAKQSAAAEAALGCIRKACPRVMASFILRFHSFLATLLTATLLCFPAALTVSLPPEPYGGHSPAGHRPTQHFPPLRSCPTVAELRRRAELAAGPGRENMGSSVVVTPTGSPMTVVSITHALAAGILDRWARARLELSDVKGAGASFVPVFFVDDPGSKQTQHDLECVRQHFPNTTVVSDDDVDALFPGLLGGTSLGPFHPVRGRWGWVLVQVLHMVAVSRRLHATSSLPDDFTLGVERDGPPVGTGPVWFIEPDVGWTETTSLPALLQYAEVSAANEEKLSSGHSGHGQQHVVGFDSSVGVASSSSSSKAGRENSDQDILTGSILDFLGPGKCSAKDNSDVFWNSKGTWETSSFRAQVQKYQVVHQTETGGTSSSSSSGDEGATESNPAQQDLGHLRLGASKSHHASAPSDVDHHPIGWRAHCQLQLIRMSQRLREVVWRDLRAGRVAYCEIHAPTAAMIRGFTVSSIPEEVLSPKFLAWEHVTEADWRMLRNQASAGGGRRRRGGGGGGGGVVKKQADDKLDEIENHGGVARRPGGLFYHSLKF